MEFKNTKSIEQLIKTSGEPTEEQKKELMKMSPEDAAEQYGAIAEEDLLMEAEKAPEERDMTPSQRLSYLIFLLKQSEGKSLEDLIKEHIKEKEYTNFTSLSTLFHQPPEIAEEIEEILKEMGVLK